MERQAYESHTDCSGLLNALLERADGLGKEDFKKWLGKGSRHFHVLPIKTRS